MIGSQPNEEARIYGKARWRFPILVGERNSRPSGLTTNSFGKEAF
jgi:hypothetical protein